MNLTKEHLVRYCSEVFTTYDVSVDFVMDNKNPTESVHHIYLIAKNGDKLLRIDKSFINMSDALNFVMMVTGNYVLEHLDIFEFILSESSLTIYKNLFKK